MSSIALFPCNYTPAAKVAESLSSSLNLKVYSDDDLIAETCTSCELDPKTAVTPDILRDMLYGKTSVFNQFTLEKEIVVNKLRSVFCRKLADTENYLFYGFQSLLVPARISNVLRTLIVASEKERIRRALSFGMIDRNARKVIHDHDASANAWALFLHQKMAYDSRLYELVVAVEKKTQKELTKEIVTKYQSSISEPDKSQRAKIFADTLLAQKVEEVLLSQGHKLGVEVQDTVAVLTVRQNVFNFNILQEDVARLAKEVDGINEVQVIQKTDYDACIYRRRRFDRPSKVLFVDDEKDFVKTVSQRLISRDVGTYGVYSGEEALDLVAEDPPDVMVLDLKMPGLHGTEVLHRTKDIAPEIEVIVLTGHGTSEDMEQCMKLGAFAYMNKPVNVEELSRTIDRAYEKIQQRYIV